MKNVKPGENTGSLVNQNKSIPCVPNGPVYNLTLTLGVTESERTLDTVTYGYSTLDEAKFHRDRAVNALANEILTMFTFEDIRCSFESNIECFEDDGKKLTRLPTLEDIHTVACNLTWDSSEDNNMISNAVCDYIEEYMVVDDE